MQNSVTTTDVLCVACAAHNNIFLLTAVPPRHSLLRQSAEYGQLTALLSGGRPELGRLAARGVALLVAEGALPLPDALRTALSSVAVGGR